MKIILTIIMTMVFATTIVVTIGTYYKVLEITNKLSLTTDILDEQQKINKGIIEILMLREDPQYRRQVTDCNKRSMRDDKQIPAVKNLR